MYNMNGSSNVGSPKSAFRTWKLLKTNNEFLFQLQSLLSQIEAK